MPASSCCPHEHGVLSSASLRHLKEVKERTKRAQRRAPSRLLTSICFALFVLLHSWMLSLATHINLHPSTPAHINPHAATSRYILPMCCMQHVCVCWWCVYMCVCDSAQRGPPPLPPHSAALLRVLPSSASSPTSCPQGSLYAIASEQ